MDCYFQNSCLLKNYVEIFLELYHKVHWYDENFKQLFWSGVNDILGQMLLLRENHLPFVEIINYALWVLTVGVVEDNTTSSVSPGSSPFNSSSRLSASSRQVLSLQLGDSRNN